MRRGAALLVSWWLCGAAAMAAVITDDRGRGVDVPMPPKRIVTLAPALTETVCALGHCSRVVGTDPFSNWPHAVRTLPKLGGVDDARIEAIVRLEPDLVLAATSTRAVARLESLGLRVLALEPRTLAEVERTISRVALALGDAAAGPVLWRELAARIDRAAARVPPRWRGQRVYFEVATVPYAAGEASFIGELLARLGLVNIVPAALGAFPQLSPEFVLRERPDVLMGSAAHVADMATRPGWNRLPAMRNGARCGFAAEPYDALMRAGPRLAEAIDALAGCLAALPAPGSP